MSFDSFGLVVLFAPSFAPLVILRKLFSQKPTDEWPHCLTTLMFTKKTIFKFSVESVIFIELHLVKMYESFMVDAV